MCTEQFYVTYVGVIELSLSNWGKHFAELYNVSTYIRHICTHYSQVYVFLLISIRSRSMAIV